MRQVIIFIFFTGIVIFAQPQIPRIYDHCLDLSGTLSEEEIGNLDEMLSRFEQSDSIQIIFLMVDHVGNYPLYQLTEKIVAENRIGHKDFNDGILFLISKQENIMRIEVGFRFEKILQPPLISSIIRNRIEPALMKNDYFSGIRSGLEAIIFFLKNYRGKEVIPDYIPRQDDQSTRGIRQIILMFLISIPLFSKKGRGLGTLFYRRTLSGRKQYDGFEFKITGLMGEKEILYGPWGGIFKNTSLILNTLKNFKGKLFSGNW